MSGCVTNMDSSATDDMFSPPKFELVSHYFFQQDRPLATEHTANDNILGTIKDLDRTIRMPDSQIARVQNTPCKEFSTCLRILVVPTSADIANKDDLTDLLAIFADISDSIVRHLCLNNS